MTSQVKRLKDHLYSGNVITRLSSFTELGIFELSARIKDLETQGIIIHRKWVKIVNRFGEEVKCKEYRLKPYE